MFYLQELKCPIDNIGHMRWTLDEPDDYKMLCKVYEHFISVGKEDFVTEDVIEFLKNNPDIEAINTGIIRNEGLAKSIREDKVVEVVE